MLPPFLAVAFRQALEPLGSMLAPWSHFGTILGLWTKPSQERTRGRNPVVQSEESPLTAQPAARAGAVIAKVRVKTSAAALPIRVLFLGNIPLLHFVELTKAFIGPGRPQSMKNGVSLVWRQ
jgi:hypothetical protein